MTAVPQPPAEQRGDVAAWLDRLEEEWRPVPGYEGRYMVSDQGRVWSAPRSRAKGGLLKPSSRGRYLFVGLSKPGGSDMRSLHRLVALVFLGPPAPAIQVRHLNGDSHDNRVSNLAYGTQSENEMDKLRHGRNRKAAQTKCLRGHSLTDPTNLILRPATGGQMRQCRKCTYFRQKRIRDLRRAELRAALEGPR